MFKRRLVCGVIFLLVALTLHAQTSIPIKLVDGTVITGRPISAKDAFLQVALDTGGYTNITWLRISQESLHELQTKATDKTVSAIAGTLIDPPVSAPRETGAKKPVALKPVPRLDRPSHGSLLASPIMLVLLLIVYAGNLYAAYEIAVFRQQPPALVCIVSAIAPVIGPAIFLAMPTRQPQAAPAMEEVVEAPVEHVEQVHTEEAPAEAPVVAQPAAPEQVVFSRGQFTFNRRFFETKFAGFLKMVPGEAERDKVIQIKSARGEFTGTRLSKLEANELFLQVKKGVASEDVMLPYSEIQEVIIKHKDA